MEFIGYTVSECRQSLADMDAMLSVLGKDTAALGDDRSRVHEEASFPEVCV